MQFFLLYWDAPIAIQLSDARTSWSVYTMCARRVDIGVEVTGRT